MLSINTSPHHLPSPRTSSRLVPHCCTNEGIRHPATGTVNLGRKEVGKRAWLLSPGKQRRVPAARAPHTHVRGPGTDIGRRVRVELRAPGGVGGERPAAETRFQRMQFPFPSKKPRRFLCCCRPSAPRGARQCQDCKAQRTETSAPPPEHSWLKEADWGCPAPWAGCLKEPPRSGLREKGLVPKGCDPGSGREHSLVWVCRSEISAAVPG